ncbi:MAG: 50S ribosomal protein L4 [Candidatus Yanofskybacteria bacterium CG10_big_fil_rev_8_21_14_0_10_36_16]|uniref:Large ribosomal subunit protein uL4 n=1 Tax=Candidatus Yanofskybacteria bacterium CG10_big_fil_rev_8_21_14_0_10_36_16 TaxID=1975096 RepID=A0A2J0Q8A5_9BACT|nr:MAG: 50S ribosomal protein L4 [Candidatus Yanofskybacteria bacterium CG10_big_fil_rev_8_21_14_0_10_36_16]
MKVEIYNQTGESTGKVDLPDEIFNLKLNEDLIRQAVLAQLGNSRQVLAHTKGRGDVRGGGAKPWRQKGTGRARHGSRRSPIWVGGGITFGPTNERNFAKKINKQTKQKALFTVLSSKVSADNMIVLDKLVFDKVKTKEAKSIVENLESKLKDYKKSKTKRDSVLFVLPESSTDTQRAFNNLPYVNLMGAKSLNVVDLLRYKYLVMLKGSIEVIEKHYK